MSKTILVTGSSRGIGAQIIRTFAKEGYNVIINYNHNKECAQKLLEEVSAYGIKAITIKCDISDEQQVKDMVTKVYKEFGSVDVLVNNAGISIDSLFQYKTVENFQKTLNVNVIGTFLVSKYFGEEMYKSKSGKIINITSTNGINTYYPMCIDYDASKSAIISLTHNLAIQFAPYVNVNAVAPGFIATQSEIQDMDDEFIKYEEEKILLRHKGTEEDVADLVFFLASDKAKFINNEVVRIDGGLYGNY